MLLRELILEAKPDNLNQPTLDKLFAAYSDKENFLTRLHDPERSCESGLEVAQKLFSAAGSEYLIWTAKQYIQDPHFFLEDLENWKNTFSQFNELKRKRHIQIERNINSYQNFSALTSAINSVIGIDLPVSEFYNRAIINVSNFVAKGQARWLYRSNQYSIYQPLSYRSSEFLREIIDRVSVCTVTGNNNYNSYSENGTIMYILDQNNFYVAYIVDDYTKFRASEFSDRANNHSYGYKYQLEHYPALRTIIAGIKQSNPEPEITLLVQPEEKHYELCKKFTETGQYKRIPVEFRKKYPDIAWIAVEQNPRNIGEVPAEIIINDHKLAKHVIEKSTNWLSYIPDKALETMPDICLDTLKKDSSVFKHLPYKFKIDPKFYVTAFENQKNPGVDIKLNMFLPKDIIEHPGIAYQAVRANPNDVRQIPMEVMDADPRIARTAVEKHPEGIRLIWTSYVEKHPELCLLDFKLHGPSDNIIAYPTTLKEYPKIIDASIQKRPHRTLQMLNIQYLFDHPEVVERAIRRDVLSITALPQKYYEKHPEIFELAVQPEIQNGWSRLLEYIPKQLQLDNPKLVFQAIKNDEGNADHMPQHLRIVDPELAEFAIDSYKYAFEFISDRLKTYDFCYHAVKKHKVNLLDIPREHRDKKLCWAAVKNSWINFNRVPEKVREENYDLCLLAVSEKGSCIGDVPMQLRDYKLCLTAARQNPKILFYGNNYIPKPVLDQMMSEHGDEFAEFRDMYYKK